MRETILVEVTSKSISFRQRPIHRGSHWRVKLFYKEPGEKYLVIGDEEPVWTLCRAGAALLPHHPDRGEQEEGRGEEEEGGGEAPPPPQHPDQQLLCQRVPRLEITRWYWGEHAPQHGAG